MYVTLSRHGMSDTKCDAISIGVMTVASSIRVVIDTKVAFEGVTKPGGAAGLIVDAWLAGSLNVCVSTVLASEYEKATRAQVTSVGPVMASRVPFAAMSADDVTKRWTILRSATPVRRCIMKV
jgi:hypothetical protein